RDGRRPRAAGDPRLPERSGRDRLPGVRADDRLPDLWLSIPGSRRHPRDADRRGREAGLRETGEPEVTDLDDVGALRAVDASDMLGTIGRLGDDCRSAYDAARALDLPSAEGVTSVVVCGMGGSAMAGEVLRSVFRDRLVVPVEVSRGHTLPAYAASH